MKIDEATSWCEENGSLPYVETSAKDAINVDKAFNMAVNIWSKLEELMDKQAVYEENVVKLRDQPSNSRTGCCTGISSTI